MARTPSRKRPCRICKRWFLPDPRVKERQKTCGRPECQREWHRRKCAEWYRSNPDYFKTNYLQKKIEAVSEAQNGELAKSTAPAFRLKSGLPHPFVKDVIGLCHLGQVFCAEHQKNLAIASDKSCPFPIMCLVEI